MIAATHPLPAHTSMSGGESGWVVAITRTQYTVQAIRNLTLTKFVRSRAMSHEIVRHRANESEFRNAKSHRKPCNLIRMKANS